MQPKEHGLHASRLRRSASLVTGLIPNGIGCVERGSVHPRYSDIGRELVLALSAAMGLVAPGGVPAPRIEALQRYLVDFVTAGLSVRPKKLPSFRDGRRRWRATPSYDSRPQGFPYVAT